MGFKLGYRGIEQKKAILQSWRTVARRWARAVERDEKELAKFKQPVGSI